MIKAKPKKVSERLPMRGHLVCSHCGGNLTGSAYKRNGGKYYHYHCQLGCKERHKADMAHERFIDWLAAASIDPVIAELYLEVMKDIFITQEGDREKELDRLNKEIQDKELKVAKAVEKLIADELDKWRYNLVKEDLSKELGTLRRKVQEIKSADNGFNQYLKYGFTLLTNLNGYYSEASTEGKRKFIGLIFPEKLVFEDGKYRTTQPNDLLSLLCSTGKGSKGLQKEKAFNNEGKFFQVGFAGIEPNGETNPNS